MIQNIKNKWLRRAIVVLFATPGTIIMVGLWLIDGLAELGRTLWAGLKSYWPHWFMAMAEAWKGREV